MTDFKVCGFIQNKNKTLHLENKRLTFLQMKKFIVIIWQKIDFFGAEVTFKGTTDRKIPQKNLYF